MNCFGCKWLDQAVNGRKGDGYCSHVSRSQDYSFENERKLVSVEEIKLYSKHLRTAEKERCELYAESDWSTRYISSNK